MDSIDRSIDVSFTARYRLDSIRIEKQIDRSEIGAIMVTIPSMTHSINMAQFLFMEDYNTCISSVCPISDLDMYSEP